MTYILAVVAVMAAFARFGAGRENPCGYCNRFGRECPHHAQDATEDRYR